MFLFLVLFFGHMVVPLPNKTNQSIKISLSPLSNLLPLIVTAKLKLHHLAYVIRENTFNSFEKILLLPMSKNMGSTLSLQKQTKNNCKSSISLTRRLLLR